MKNYNELMTEDDCFIRCDGFTYETTRECKHLGEFDDFSNALNCINENQTRDQVYYNIWFINDHGNVDLIDHKGNILQSWV